MPDTLTTQDRVRDALDTTPRLRLEPAGEARLRDALLAQAEADLRAKRAQCPQAAGWWERIEAARYRGMMADLGDLPLDVQTAALESYLGCLGCGPEWLWDELCYLAAPGALAQGGER